MSAADTLSGVSDFDSGVLADNNVNGPPYRRGATITQRYASMPGNYPDRTVLANFHSSSEGRKTKVFEFRCPCRISVGDRYLFTINDDVSVFPDQLINPVVGRRSPTSDPASIYKIDEIWIIVEDQDQPLLVDPSSFSQDRKSVRCTTRFLSGSIGTSYENATAIYNVTFIRVAITDMFFGTIGGGVARQSNGLYTATFKTKFPTSPTVPLPTAVYLRMAMQAEDGKWVDYVPKVLGSSSPLKLGHPTRAINRMSSQYAEGFDHSIITADGYVEYIVEDLPADTKFSAFISNVSNSPNFLKLVRDAGDTSSDYYLMQAATIPQPIRPCHIRTPPKPTSNEVIRVAALSCMDGYATPLKSLEGNGDHVFKVFNGDNYYQDSSEDLFDYEQHYDGLWRNDPWFYAAIDGCNYFLADDHEVRDNWDSLIGLHQGNAPQFQLTPQEAELYNWLMTKNGGSFTPYMPFTRIANDGLRTSVLANEQIQAAYHAFDKLLPTMPHNKDHVKRNWSERWGRVLALFVNSKPYLNNDGSIDYWKRRARVTGATTQNQTIDWHVAGPNERMNQFIPSPGLEFIKDALMTDRNGPHSATAKLIFFSSNVTPNYSAQHAAFLAKVVQESLPFGTGNVQVNAGLATSMFNKLWFQRRVDKADATPNPDVLELVAWMKANYIKNVFFVTGDPHNSTVQYLDKDNVIVEACLSTVGNYRSNSITATFAGKPSNTNALVNVVENSWGDVAIDPMKRTACIRIMNEKGPLATVDIPLA
jgi:hypothetical protein